MVKVSALLSSLLTFALLDITLVFACSKLHQYNTKLQPECHELDKRIKWPNYEDQSYFIQCIAIGKAELVKCPAGQVFVYVLQSCKACENYIAPVECSRLPTTNPPKCVPIEDGNGNGGEITTATPIETTDDTTTTTVEITQDPTYFTPKYPNETTTIATETEATDGADSTNETKVTENVTNPEENESTQETDFPGPPSPTTTDPDVPQPETAEPTPPQINFTPPSNG